MVACSPVHHGAPRTSTPPPQRAQPATRLSSAPVTARAPAPVDTQAPARPIGWLKGQTHVHTSRSYDASTPPEDVVRFYAEHDYDFVVITDHNRVTAVSAPAGSDLLVFAGAELTQNSSVCKPGPAKGFRCLFHTSAVFADAARDPAGGERFTPSYQVGRFDAYRTQFEYATRTLGGLAILNHPQFHFAANARLIARLAQRGLRHVELFNAALSSQNPNGKANAERSAERLWDAVLSAGGRVFAVAADDAHHFADAVDRRRNGKSAYVGDRAWIEVRARRDADSIRAALNAGDFYATTGPKVTDLKRAFDEYRVAIDANSQPVRIQFVGPGGKVLSETNGVTATHSGGDEPYIRARILAQDGGRAWLQPAWR